MLDRVTAHAWRSLGIFYGLSDLTFLLVSDYFVMTDITFYGGVNDIGGNKFLVEDKGTKIFMDFGMSFGDEGKFFSQFMNART